MRRLYKLVWQGGPVVFVQRRCSLSGIMAGTVSTDAVTSVEHQTDTHTDTRTKKGNTEEKRGTHVKFRRVSAPHRQTARSFQRGDIAQLFVCAITE